MTSYQTANHTRIENALAALLDWGRDHTRHTDPDSPHALLIEAHRALGRPELAHPIGEA